jgi:hypothetical protein
VDVRHIVLGRAARPGRSHGAALTDDVAFAHCDRAELDERHRIAAGRLHRHDLPVRADGARETHDARGRRKDRLLALARHVDPPVLAARVGVAAVDEGLENPSSGRPGPPVGGGRSNKRGEGGGDYSKAAHGSLLVGGIDNELP